MTELSHKVDVVVHVDETLDERRRHDIESALTEKSGVRWAKFTDKRPHLMMVEYDPDLVSSMQIVERINQQQVHAELIGPI
jgi:hypothetical protein